MAPEGLRIRGSKKYQPWGCTLFIPCRLTRRHVPARPVDRKVSHRPASHVMRMRWRFAAISKLQRAGRPSLVFQPISPGDNFEFAADGFVDRYDRVHLEHERREHRTEFVNGHQIIAFHQHVTAPLPDSDHKEVDLEIGWRLPLAKHLKYSFLCILVFRGRTLRAFEPADHVLHRRSPRLGRKSSERLL